MRKTGFVCQKQSFHELAFSTHEVLELPVRMKVRNIMFFSFLLIIFLIYTFLGEKITVIDELNWSGSVVSLKNGKCSIRFKLLRKSKT